MRTFPGSFRTFPGNVQGRQGEIVGASALTLHAEEADLDEASQLAGSGVAADIEYPAVICVVEAWVPKEVLAQSCQTSVEEFGNSGAEADERQPAGHPYRQTRVGEFGDTGGCIQTLGRRLVEEADGEHTVIHFDLGCPQATLLHLVEDPRNALSFVAHDSGVRQDPNDERITSRMHRAALLKQRKGHRGNELARTRDLHAILVEPGLHLHVPDIHSPGVRTR